MFKNLLYREDIEKAEKLLMDSIHRDIMIEATDTGNVKIYPNCRLNKKGGLLMCGFKGFGPPIETKNVE